MFSRSKVKVMATNAVFKLVGIFTVVLNLCEEYLHLTTLKLTVSLTITGAALLENNEASAKLTTANGVTFTPRTCFNVIGY